MNPLWLTGAILAMLCTVSATVLMLVFCVAGAPNSSAAQLRMLKLWAGGLSLVSLVCIGAAVFLLFLKRPGWATGTALLPTVTMLAIFAVLMLRG